MKIIIACGCGIATSTMMAERIKGLLGKNGLQARFIQCSVNEVEDNLENATLVVSAMEKLEVKGVPLVNALSYITGIEAEATDTLIEEILLKNKDS